MLAIDRAKLLYRYDQAAWHTTDAMRRDVPDAALATIRGWVVTPDGDGWRLQGQVEGSEPRPYTVNAELRVSPGGNLSEWRSGCTCPVGRYCKHGAALGILASMQGLALLNEWGPNGPSPEALERR